MDIIEKSLQLIASCIQNKVYKEVETERFEVKDLSAGWGDDWYKSVCAFLNSNGGIIVIGINDKNNAKPAYYKFTGYINSDANEKHLKQELPKKFTDKNGNSIDLSMYISKFEIRDFLDGKVAVVYVEELADDEKYVYYNGNAYQRKLTGDHVLTKAEIELYEELKKDIIKEQELEIIENTSLESLNVDKLNQYILRLNMNRKVETIKADINSSLSFLERKGFIRNKKPTLLGMLLCGNHVEDFISGKCDVNCSIDLPISNMVLTSSKQRYQDNIINLIDDSFSFIWRNIRVGVGFANGGTALPEYPEQLIREIVNNALIHRSYSSNRPTIIEIKPKQYLKIQNAGYFAQRQIINIDTNFGKVRRIIPIQISRNPKLANLLYSFDRFEGAGNGLASLIDVCLDNKIDTPYYILTDGEIKLFIPTGKVFDEAMESLLNSFNGYILQKNKRELTEDEKIILSFFYKSEMLNRVESYTILLTMDNNHKEVIANLEEIGLIFKDPASPEIYPIYRVDRTLLKKDVSDLLQNIFGKEWNLLKTEHQEVLQAIYWHSHYSIHTDLLNANSVAKIIYTKNNNNLINLNDLKDYENFKRKIRNIFNQLESKNFIVRKDGKTKENGGKSDFVINENL